MLKQHLNRGGSTHDINAEPNRIEGMLSQLDTQPPKLMMVQSEQNLRPYTAPTG